MGLFTAIAILILAGIFWRQIIAGGFFLAIAGGIALAVLFVFLSWNIDHEKKQREEKAGIAVAAKQKEEEEVKRHDRLFSCELEGSKSSYFKKTGVRISATPIDKHPYDFTINDISKLALRHLSLLWGGVHTALIVLLQ